MSKIAILGDTHFGVRGNSEQFHDNMELFFSNIFFPFLRENPHRWDYLVHLGDIFHDRRRIDVLTSSRARKYFFEPLNEILKSQGKSVFFICGNHDIYYRDSLSVNSINEFVSGHFDEDVFPKVITEPTVEYGNLFLPWITNKNRDEVKETINKFLSESNGKKYCFAHLELKNFKFSKTQIATHGDDPELFSGFTSVYTGHYHYRHSKGNIHYVGSASQHTWIDVDTVRGFHILNDETDEKEFIENPYNIFENLKFSDLDNIEGNHKRFFRIFIEDNDEREILNAKLENISSLAYDIEIIQTNNSVVKVKNPKNLETIENIEATPDFIRSFVHDTDIAEILIGYYNEASQL